MNDVDQAVLAFLTGLLALGFTGLGISKIRRSPTMVDRAQHLGLSAADYVAVGVLEVLGSVALVLGAVLWPGVGIAASSAFVLLLLGALVMHRRAGDGLKGAGPALGFLIAVVAQCTLVVGLA